ncbi:hypothetical protein BDA99DRAFT_78846 [Phascolomyces articulosus]|uniref:Transcription activator GCR1-like domain-containing protein n=1 Tax=Phascolomyces articulosus TaxID=60185 RepID=A0AAD5JZ01_9FUNG|nr:hypothetical protein BDA99DRAFT_78846 [Phascolomyces articulosus]
MDTRQLIGVIPMPISPLSSQEERERVGVIIPRSNNNNIQEQQLSLLKEIHEQQKITFDQQKKSLQKQQKAFKDQERLLLSQQKALEQSTFLLEKIQDLHKQQVSLTTRKIGDVPTSRAKRLFSFNELDGQQQQPSTSNNNNNNEDEDEGEEEDEQDTSCANDDLDYIQECEDDDLDYIQESEDDDGGQQLENLNNDTPKQRKRGRPKKNTTITITPISKKQRKKQTKSHVNATLTTSSAYSSPSLSPPPTTSDYQLNQTIASVHDVWREYSVGLSLCEPPIKNLTHLHCQPFFKNERLPIISEIKKLMEKNSSDEVAVLRLEAYRINKNLNLKELCKRIIVHRVMDQERGITPPTFI